MICFDDTVDTAIVPSNLHFYTSAPADLDSEESDEISHIFPAFGASATRSADGNNRSQSTAAVVVTASSPLLSLPLPTVNAPRSHNNSIPPVATVQKLLSGDLHTHCEFDVRHLDEYSPELGRAFECYDELIDSGSDTSADDDDDDDDDHQADAIDASCCDSSGDHSPFAANHCECTSDPGSPPSPRTDSARCHTMRETGPLRGLLKNPNRPAPTHKNRVVFDETQNKFFDADYIILIREDCPYDEEDEEPCTCGEHELVRLCCEEGCQCTAYGGSGGGGGEDMRTPQVSQFSQ